MGSIDVRRGVANYQETWKRNACCNCGHVKREAEPRDIGKASYTCELHAFYVQRFAICDQWEPMK